jgi:hypothetical protein
VRTHLKSWIVVGCILFAALAAYGQAPAGSVLNVYLLKSGSLTAANASCTATACVSMPVNWATGSVGVQVAGTFVGTVTFEGTLDGTNYVSILGLPAAGGAVVSTATGVGTWQIPNWGYATIRARCSAFTSGTITLTMVRSPLMVPVPSSVALAAALSVTSLTSSGAIAGTMGTFSGAVSGTTGTFTGALSGPPVSGTAPMAGIWTSGFVPNSLTTGTDTTGVANQQWIAPIYVPNSMTLNGVAYLIGSVGGTDKAIVALYNAAGTTLLANSSTAGGGTTVGTAGTTQALAFTGAYAAVGPALFWVTVQTNGTTAKIRTVPLGVAPNGVQAAGGAAPASTITSVPTTFTAAYSPIAVVY